MKATASTRTVVAILAVCALAIAFWMLLLAPKRDEVAKLDAQTERLQTQLSENQSTVVAGEEAKKSFPTNYQQLVVLGKAVPAGDESASLLIQLNHISADSKVKFESLKVGANDGSAAEAPPPEAAPESSEGGAAPEEAAPTTVPASAAAPTESTAASLPIGATIGPAGLSVLPYDVSFSGSFFHVADFIKGIDSMIHTKNSDLAVDGRLVTFDGFALSGNPTIGFPYLDADFSVTTYLVPSDQGITAGASAEEPGEVQSTTVANELR